jgi:hypothetical protein
MARGRGYGGPVIITSSGADDALLGSASSRASRLASYTVNDQDEMRRKSRRQDQALLDNITTKLHRLEFDRVKPDREVALKTGFRRLLYHKKRPPLEKETREKLHLDRLRYPWDYTNDNPYRGKTEKEKQKKKSIKEKAKEQAEPNHYPEYDPLGVYKPREKRNRAPYPDASLRTKKWETADVREMLTDLRVKAFSKKITRDPSDDTDTILRDLSRPLPKSEVSNYVPYTGNLYEFKPTYDADFEMDPRVHKKIAESKVDLDEFDRILNERFTKKFVPGLSRADQILASAQMKSSDEIRREEKAKLLRNAREYDLAVTYDDNLDDQVIEFLY